MSSPHRGPSILVPGTAGPQRWDLGLARDVPLDLRVEAHAADLDLDLADLTAPHIDADVVAGSLALDLPTTGSTSVRLEATLSRLIVRVPRGVAVRVRLYRRLSPLRVRADGLRHVRDDLFETPDYATSTLHADIVIDARLTRVEIVS